MSQGPSTLGSMMTSSLAPTAGTISRMSSSPQGELSALMRVHRPVWPKSWALAISMKPLPRRRLGVGGDGVLEVAEHDVDLGDQLAQPGADLLVVRRHEVDHALEPHGQLPVGLRRADGERREMLGGRAGGGHGGGPLLRCNKGHSRSSSDAVSNVLSSLRAREGSPPAPVAPPPLLGRLADPGLELLLHLGRDPLHVVGLAWPCAAP